VTGAGQRCTLPSTGPALSGLFRAGGDAGAVVAPPHPVYGGELGNPVVTATARGLAAAGASVLAFDYRGVGGSLGAVTDDPAAAREDYAAALAGLAARVPGPYLAAGYSFGAAAALATAAADRRVRAAVLVAPPLAMLDAAQLAGFGGPALVVLGDRDGYAPIDGLRAALADRPGTALEVLPGIDHFFSDPAGLGELSRLVAEHVPAWL
jgi:uncharacterized protein